MPQNNKAVELVLKEGADVTEIHRLATEIAGLTTNGVVAQTDTLELQTATLELARLVAKPIEARKSTV